MFRSFFGPVAQLAFYDARVDAIPARFEALLRNFRKQIMIPASQPGLAAWYFRQATAENLQCVHEGEFSRGAILENGGFVHELADYEVSQQQSINFLHRSRVAGCRAAPRNVVSNRCFSPDPERPGSFNVYSIIRTVIPS